jgi:hypothetical protein
MRDPGGGGWITSGDKTLPVGGPLGTILGFAGFVVISVIFIGSFIGLERFLQLIVPQWLLFPLTVLALGVLIIAAFAGIIRAAEWRRTR